MPEFNSTIQSDRLLAIGSIDDRMLILIDIDKLMSGADMGLVEQTLQQGVSSHDQSHMP